MISWQERTNREEESVFGIISDFTLLCNQDIRELLILFLTSSSSFSFSSHFDSLFNHEWVMQGMQTKSHTIRKALVENGIGRPGSSFFFLRHMSLSSLISPIWRIFDVIKYSRENKSHSGIVIERWAVLPFYSPIDHIGIQGGICNSTSWVEITIYETRQFNLRDSLVTSLHMT